MSISEIRRGKDTVYENFDMIDIRVSANENETIVVFLDVLGVWADRIMMRLTKTYDHIFLEPNPI